MQKRWLLFILCTSFALLSVLKTHELKHITPFFRSEKVIKLQSFQKAQGQVSKNDQDLLKLWESMLTGRSAPVAKWMKERYKRLGLSHLFTPSGFHISAVLFPFMKILPGKFHLYLILLLGGAVSFLPGLGALKRMLLIKAHQKLLGFHLGFILALLLDMMWGSFQTGALSFTYSFLFIGIIYSGTEGLSLIIWIFIGQMMITYFQQADISPLLLIISPLLNLGFSLALPILFLLSFPLWKWQLSFGLLLLKGLQLCVDGMAFVGQFVPALEVHVGVFLILILLMKGKRNVALVGCLLFSSSLNLDRGKIPSLPGHEFRPHGTIQKIIYNENEVRVLREDGNCKLRLVKGVWWENCSPRRRSSDKRLKKLSYPS